MDEFLNILNGKLEIVFSNELTKKYRCFLKNKIELDKTLIAGRRFILIFDTHPFKYSNNELDEELEVEAPTSIYNIGNVESEPTITIYGTGAITLHINDKSYKFQNVSELVTINSEIMEVYRGSFNENNNYISADFPILEVGENKINWTGNCSGIKIKPNWRWL